jgi:CheY-like chemotaxis protein
MPGLSGFELAARVRERPWGSQVTLIAITGWGQAEDRRRSLEAGFDHHLTKPIEFEALRELLSRNPLSGA